MKKAKCENFDETSQNIQESEMNRPLKEKEIPADFTEEHEVKGKSDIHEDKKAKKGTAPDSDAKTYETTEPVDVKDKQIADLSDKFMRLAAEYDNFRRRTQKEKDALYNESVTTVSAVWLPVVDNLERALVISSGYKHEEARKIKEGINMILAQAQSAMCVLGITEIEALNKKFDHQSMDAIMHVEDKDLGESVVVEVFEKGYMRGDKVIRHAVVKVAN